MSLATYKKKRDFKTTPEPQGGRAAKGKHALHYVIQKHDASRLHYDFRLELDGTLKSWAVPKGPSLDPARKALAVQVEDHPLDYETFEGVIPKGQYGGGTVMVWDRGTWEPLEDPREGLAKGKLRFALHGEKLRGQWSLVQMHGGAGGDGKNWLLMKARDAYADSRDILHDAPDSAATRRSLEEIAEHRDAVWDSKRGRVPQATPNVPHNGHALNGKHSPRHKHAGENKHGAHGTDAMPTQVVPQLATLAEHPPQGEQWIHEIKFDGYRLLAFLREGKVELHTRKNLDWTARFARLVEPLQKLDAATAILDGEAVVLNARGQSDFQLLQSMFKGKGDVNLRYFVFDLLYLNGRDLRQRPLLERKELLRQLLETSGQPAPIEFSDHVQGDGDEIIKRACALGSEGIVSKRADAPYVPRRDASWRKTKCGRRQEFVIVGYTRSDKRKGDMRSLLLGVYDAEDGLVYCGRVGTGFDTKKRAELLAEFAKIEQDKMPLDIPPPPRESRADHWVKPVMVCEVQYENWTRDGVLRHPSFVGVRQDKPAKEVVREKPAELVPENAKSPARPKREARRESTAAPRRKKAAAAEPRWGGARITHPDKIIYPQEQLSKADLANYYEVAAPFMVPLVAERPLALLRCPAGMAQKCFFARNWSNTMPAEIGKVAIGGGESHVMIQDAGGLFARAQISALEIHMWNCHVQDLLHPDQFVFDLDPGPDVSWKQVREGAQRVRELLESLGMKPFLKTSGGKGLHLVVPIKPNVGWSEAKAFCKALADHLAGEDELFIAKMSKSLRAGKIYVDYLGNDRTATAVAPYSSRARAGAAVSMPLAWEELREISGSDQFTLKNAAAYLAKRRTDPWDNFARAAVDVHRVAGQASIKKE